jgi:hypothetical protein
MADEKEIALYGHTEKPPMAHQVGAQLVHATPKPLVHMVCWDTDEACRVEVSGTVTVVGDEKAPVAVRMTHSFADPHHQTHTIAPVHHTLRVDTDLARPIHHALQMRTPLQVRFCNPWHVASDYVIEARLGGRSMLSVRITGATVATPQPCDEEPCPPVATDPFRP